MRAKREQEPLLFFTHPPSLSSLWNCNRQNGGRDVSRIYLLVRGSGYAFVIFVLYYFRERNLDAILVYTKQTVLDELLDGVELSAVQEGDDRP